MVDLETATIDELYSEIASRCKGCIVIIRKQLKNPRKNEIDSAFSVHYKDFTLSLGLLEQAKFYFRKYYLESFEDISPSEIGLEE